LSYTIVQLDEYFISGASSMQGGRWVWSDVLTRRTLLPETVLLVFDTADSLQCMHATHPLHVWRARAVHRMHRNSCPEGPG
jgi:hypothetical protein